MKRLDTTARYHHYYLNDLNFSYPLYIQMSLGLGRYCNLYSEVGVITCKDSVEKEKAGLALRLLFLV